MGLHVMCASEMGHGGRMKKGSVFSDKEKGFGEEEDMKVMSDGCVLVSACDSSSIGKNSDAGFENVNEENEEVESGFNAGGVGSLGSMQAMEDALPMNWGLSMFFSGKTKSFTRLTDASLASSIKEIEKPDNRYSKRTRNERSHSLVSDKHINSNRLKSSGGVSKKSTVSTRTTLGLAVAMGDNPKSNATRENPDSKPSSGSSLSPRCSQTTQTKFKSSRRTVTFADMEQCGSL